MALTHILVDFENVQPSAADIALVRGDGLRLAIFRGPGQMKYSADVAEAWQPLGASVSFIHCAKAGRNAVDMHIAFYLGEQVAAPPGGGAPERARFVIVSKDTDFDPLLMSIRARGYDATRVSSIKAALGGRGAEPKPEKARASRVAPAAKAAKATAKAPAAKKPVTKKTAAKAAKAAAPAEKKAPPAAKMASGAPDAMAKVIDSLRRMGDRRPAKRAGLERHIESHLGRDLAPGVLQSLLQQLERDGVLAFDENKVQYHLPRARK